MSEETCGDYGGRTGEDDPCGRTSGWGRDTDTGRCKHHVDGPGRPPKLTYENQEQIAAVIEQGGSITEAARKCGIHRETIGRWAEKGRQQDEGIFADFYDRLTRAQGQGEATYRQALLQIAIETDDTATLMAMLKQRYPDAWGEVKRGEQSGLTVELKRQVVEKLQEDDPELDDIDQR